MATALDLLMSAKEDVNLLSEESDICTIDDKTRAIFVPSTIVVGGVQSDKNAERIKFSCPKIVGDNLDLSKFSVRINFENVSSVDFNVSIKDQYICDDVAVDGENVTFSWLIGRNAARYMGTVRFIVCAVKTDSDSNISVEWNTTIAEVPVLEGIEIDQPQIGQEEKDVINQLLELTKNTSAEAVQNVNSAKEQAIKDIQSVSQPDTTLTVEGGLAEAKATGEAIGSLKEDIDNQKEAIQLPCDENAPDCQFTIYKTPYGFSSNKNCELSSSVDMYLDYKNGRNLDGYGFSENKPAKYLWWLLKIISESSDTDFTIHVSTNDGIIPANGLLDDSVPSTISGKNIKIVGSDENKAKLIGSYQNELEWTLENNYYVSTVNFTVTAIVSELFTDERGNLIPFKNVNSVHEVSSTSNSWCKIENTLYVNYKFTPSIQNHVHICYPCKNFQLSLRSNSKLILENILLFMATGIKNMNGFCDVLAIDGNETTELIVKNCTFEGAVYDVSSNKTSGSGLSVQSCKGYYEKVDCCYNCGDGFSYSNPYWDDKKSKLYPTVELSCYGYENGDLRKTGTSNASTSHYPVNVIRCGCIGKDNAGPCFADVGGARVINYQCKAITTRSNPYYGFEIGGGNCDGYLWLISCSSVGHEKSLGVGFGSVGDAYCYIDNIQSWSGYDVAYKSRIISSVIDYKPIDYLKLFSNIACIGDSLTEGDYGNGKGIHKYNYPFALSRLNNCSVTNLGISGQSAKSWWVNKDTTFTAEQLDFSRYDCFFILLGQNGGLGGNMDASDDSNLGYYCKLIESIQSANANASVFLLTIPHNSNDNTNNERNEIIKSIGANYGTQVLDLRNSNLLTIDKIDINQPYDKALHYGKVGSLTLASEIKRLAEIAIFNNLEEYNVIN